MRAHAWLKRNASDSIPFIKMMRTRVKASSSSLLMGSRTMSFQSNSCLSSAIPFSRRMSMAIGSSFLSSGPMCSARAAVKADVCGNLYARAILSER